MRNTKQLNGTVGKKSEGKEWQLATQKTWGPVTGVGRKRNHKLDGKGA